MGHPHTTVPSFNPSYRTGIQWTVTEVRGRVIREFNEPRVTLRPIRDDGTDWRDAGLWDARGWQDRDRSHARMGGQASDQAKRRGQAAARNDEAKQSIGILM